VGIIGLSGRCAMYTTFPRLLPYAALNRCRWDIILSHGSKASYLLLGFYITCTRFTFSHQVLDWQSLCCHSVRLYRLFTSSVMFSCNSPPTLARKLLCLKCLHRLGVRAWEWHRSIDGIWPITKP